MKPKYNWSGDAFNTARQVRKAVESALADHLCNGEGGAVERGRQTYNLEICVHLVDPDTGRRVLEAESKPRLRTELADGVQQAQSVADCWETGHLASAVRSLQRWKRRARRVLAALS